MGGNPVNGNGAFPDEMNAEALVFMDALRAAVPTRPDPRLGAGLVPRLAATARASTLEAETRSMRRGTAATALAPRHPRSRRALVARVAIGVALIPLVFAGLAVAGVTVPSPARSAFESVGIDLPNQPAEKSNKGEGGQSPQPSTQDTATQGAAETGGSTAQGQGNSQAAHQHARSQHGKAKGKAVGHERGKAVGLNEATPPGHTGRTGHPAHSNAGGHGGGSSGNSPSRAPKAPHAPKGVANGHTKTPHAPKGVANGHTKTPPGQSK
jgi:hypothetical protein